MAHDVLACKQDLPDLKMIILSAGNVSKPNNNIMKWDDAMKIGRENSEDNPVFERHLRMAINECCLLIYTSGTTGNPKGEIYHRANLAYLTLPFLYIIKCFEQNFYFLSHTYNLIL